MTSIYMQVDQRDPLAELWKLLLKNTHKYVVPPSFYLRSVCTEAGMFAIRARRKTVTEKDFLDAVSKVIKGYQKFSATPKYMVYN